MRRQLLSVLSIVSLVAPVIVLFQIPAAACGGKEPETLLDLYRNSTSIHIARFREEEQGEPKKEEDEADYLITDIIRRFDVSSTLKGQAVKSVTLRDREYDYQPGPEEFKGYETLEEVEADNRLPETKSDEVEADEETDDDEDTLDEESGEESLVPGVEVLLFLKPGEEKGVVELTDYSDGIKILPRPAMNAYEARIKDLNTIFKKEKPDDEAIVDWLVRCAEGPETRWEGTYELERSFRFIDFRNQRDAERKAKIAQGELVEEEEKLTPWGSSGNSVVYAERLNEYHKQTLANLLINANFRADPRVDAGFATGDAELMRLVSRWASARIAAVLVDRVRSATYAVYENHEMMDAIGSILDDDELSTIADKFGEVAYQDDAAQIHDRYLKDAKGSEEAQDEGSAKSAGAEPEKTDGDEEKKPDAPPAEKAAKSKPAHVEKTVEALRPTYKQFRSDLIAKFLLRADKVIADPQAQIAEKHRIAVEKLLSEKPPN